MFCNSLSNKKLLTASVGLRSLRLAQHEDYSLTVPCQAGLVTPAVMADREEQREAEVVWRTECRTSTSTLATSTLSLGLVLLSLI